MPFHLRDLSIYEIDMLGRMHEGSPSGEPIGLALHEFEDRDATIAHLLLAKGLVVMRSGWRGSFWLLPTKDGRRIYREGLID